MSNFFEKPKSKILPSTSIFAQVVDRTVLPSTIDLCLYICLYNVRGWGEGLTCLTVDRDTETLKYHSKTETGTNSQTPDASPPSPPLSTRTG